MTNQNELAVLLKNVKWYIENDRGDNPGLALVLCVKLDDAMASLQEAEPITQYRYSCGCVTCVCENVDQCLGCGAKSCRDKSTCKLRPIRVVDVDAEPVEIELGHGDRLVTDIYDDTAGEWAGIAISEGECAVGEFASVDADRVADLKPIVIVTTTNPKSLDVIIQACERAKAHLGYPPAKAEEAEPVAWMHSDPERVDVIHTKVKGLLKASATEGGGFHRPLDKSERYTIPLYPFVHPAKVQVPEGWKLVPIESSQWMRTQGGEGFEDGSVIEIWRRMVNASPEPPTEG